MFVSSLKESSKNELICDNISVGKLCNLLTVQVIFK